MAEIEYIEIDPVSRKILSPAGMLLGVMEDADSERKYFKCPKIVGDDIDLSQFQIYFKYTQATDKDGTKFETKEPGIYHCDDVNDEGDYITFSWKLSGNVFLEKGFIAFSMFASDGDVVRWGTTTAVGTVLLTIPGGLEEVAERYPDIISQLLNRMDAVESIATPEAMQNYVEAYLVEHPAELDETLTDNTKAAPAGMVGEMKEEISSLSEEIANLPSGGSGLTDEQISAFDSFFSTLTGDEESKREKDKLIKLLKGIAIVNYTITLNGDNFSIDNDSREVEENQSWGVNISFSDGFEAESITVLMGDDDVTETAVSGNTVAINSVTGNVVITIIAREITVPTTLLYSNDGVVFTDDSESLHTGVNLSEYAEFTILMNIKSLTNFMWGNQDIISSGLGLKAVRFGKHGDGTFSISKSSVIYIIPETVIAKKTSNFESSIPFALTFNSGVQKVYSFMDGAMTKTDDVANLNLFSNMGELIISPLKEEGYNMGDRWLGEIANIKVYSEILSDSAIDEYMRGL